MVTCLDKTLGEKSLFLKSSKNGQGLVELILAIAVFSLLVPSLAVMVLGSFRSLQQGGEQTEALALAQEGWEAIKAIKDRAWNENVYDQSGVQVNGSQWDFMGEGSSETIGKYTRTITFNTVCRDQTHEIIACPGIYTDIHSKLVNVRVEWLTSLNKTNVVEFNGYLTNWDSINWEENQTSDFSDGQFNQTEVNTTLGDENGSITLQNLN